MEEALIQYKNVEIHQQELCVLSDVNLELHKGEFVYLIGKVGSGKTSLLKTFYGELDVIDGEAEVLGYNMRSIKRKHIPQLRRKLGIVFQDFQLLTDRTVYNNLEFVLRATGWKNKREIQERIEEVLDLVGMSNKGYKLPNELSGGEEGGVGRCGHRHDRRPVRGVRRGRLHGRSGARGHRPHGAGRARPAGRLLPGYVRCGLRRRGGAHG